MRALGAAGGVRVAIYSVENRAGYPIHVHAKLCIIDGECAKAGSDNINRRSWTHDSEMACAVVDQAPAGPAGHDGTGFARALRLRLAREHPGPGRRRRRRPAGFR